MTQASAGSKADWTGERVVSARRDSEQNLGCLLVSPGLVKKSWTKHYTEEALKELFRHVNNNMPDSAKKKKLVRQLVKQTTTPSKDNLQVPAAAGKKHPRSRSFGGLIKRKNRGDQLTAEKRLRHVSPDPAAGRKHGKENVLLQSVNSPLLGQSGLVVKNQDFNFNKLKPMKATKDSPSVTRMCFSPAQEISV
ncbi:rho GTPase-activating protein 19 [Synchiropus picturatus]